MQGGGAVPPSLPCAPPLLPPAGLQELVHIPRQHGEAFGNRHGDVRYRGAVREVWRGGGIARVACYRTATSGQGSSSGLVLRPSLVTYDRCPSALFVRLNDEAHANACMVFVPSQAVHSTSPSQDMLFQVVHSPHPRPCMCVLLIRRAFGMQCCAHDPSSIACRSFGMMRSGSRALVHCKHPADCARRSGREKTDALKSGMA